MNLTTYIMLDKQDLINLIKSVKPELDECPYVEKIGYLIWKGNQSNIQWWWDESKLHELSKKHLAILYWKLKNHWTVLPFLKAIQAEEEKILGR